MIPLATAYAMLGDTPMWAAGLIVGLVLTYTFAIFGVAIGKTGRSPFWGILVLVPGAVIVMLAIMAFGRWPALNPEPSLMRKK